MESQETLGLGEKGARRKLKRIVKKKAKVLHNGSSSVAYYKKVKAALNASLNSSKVRQSLQANNKALAQSLQQVKQELRFVLNENARFKLENQDLNIKLLRVQNRERTSGEQSDLERRLHGMKMLLHQISSHMLGVGNCINDGIDLCHLSPRMSQTSASRPASMSTFTTANTQDSLDASTESSGCGSSVSNGLDIIAIEEPVEAELYSEYGDVRPVPLSLAAPDMSIILEQSIVMDDGLQSDLHPMEPVLEEAVESTKKPSGISKLPQRVRNVASSSSSDDESDPSGLRSRLSFRKANLTTNSKTESSSVSTNELSQRGPFTLDTPACPSRRNTFVVSKTALVLTGEDSEGIDSVEMPDLVAGVITSEAERSPKADQSAVENVPQDDDTSKSQSSSPKISKNDRPKGKPVQGKSDSTDLPSTTHKLTSQKKEDAARSAKSVPSFRKPAPVLLPSKSNKKNEADFFIMNPCSLNLVHQRNTGSDDGCIGSGRTEQVKKSSSVNQFLALIKDSNSRSRKIASLSPSGTQKHGKDADQETKGVGAAVVDKPLGTDVDQETTDASVADTGDETTYFSVDMEFTDILPPVQSLETMAEEELGAQSRPKDLQHTQEENQCKDSAEDMPVKRARTKPRSKPARSKKNMSQDREGAESDSDGTNTLKVEEKKLPVAMRLGKAGQMVFAATRKEEDGSRKAVPAKPARSKSKKKMEEMLKNLPNEEPKSVFDFHDRTPRQTEDKPKAPASVFDISLDESSLGSVHSLASFREKFAFLTKEIQIQESQKNNSCTASENSVATKVPINTAPASLLGNAPEYRLPLKGDDPDSEFERVSCSRGRSSSRGRAQRQSRSKSRSKAGGEGDKDVGESTELGSKHGRSRSRKKAEDDADFEVGKSRGRSRSRHKESRKDLDEVETEEPRRSARSKSNARKAYVEEDSSFSLEDSIVDTVQVEGKSGVENRGRSKNLHKHDEDDDYKAKTRPQQRGRSRHRKGELAADVDSSDKQEAKRRSGMDDISATLSEAVDNTHKDTLSCLSQDQSGKSVSSEGDTVEKEEAAKLRQKSSRKSRSKSAKKIDSGEESSTVVSDTALPSKVTDRRHRSRSAHKRLYAQLDADDAFGLSAPITDTNPLVNSLHASDHVEKRKSNWRTGSRGEALHQKEDVDEMESDDTTSADNIKSVASVQNQDSAKTVSSAPVDHKLSSASEIQDKHDDRNSNNDTSHKCVKHPEDTSRARKTPHQDSASIVEGMEDSRLAGGKRSISTSQVNSTDSSPVPGKKVKPSVQPVDSRDDKGREKSSAAANNAQKKSSEVTQADCSSSEKNKHLLQLEEVKRKLQEIDSRSLHKDEDPLPQPAKKSRPLVLPTFTSVAADTTSAASSSKSLTSLATNQQEGKGKSASATSKKCSKSQHGSPKDKKATKSQPASPKEKKIRSKPQPGCPKEKMTVAKSQPGSPNGRKSVAAYTSAESSPAASARSSLQLSKDDESGADIKRGRRAAAAVSYKEPSLNAKLRRGDPFTTFLHREQQLHVYKSPKRSRKHSKSGRLEREALTDRTNVSIAEVEVVSTAGD